MFAHAFACRAALGRSCRIGPLARGDDRPTTREIVTLLGAGAVAAVAIAVLSLGIRVPGHAILRAALPMVAGIALVPRRLAGSVMALGAATTAALMFAAGAVHWQPASLVALLALGPAIDLAMAGANSPGWWIYVRFAGAGALANSLAFAVRAGSAWLAVDGPGPHRLNQFGWPVFLSFALCGAAAGLLSAAVCFRRSETSE